MIFCFVFSSEIRLNIIKKKKKELRLIKITIKTTFKYQTNSTNKINTKHK